MGAAASASSGGSPTSGWEWSTPDPVDAPHKFAVSLGGQLWDNCTRDDECPGNARCFVNATWAAFDRMCSCEPGSVMGPTCAEQTPTAKGVTAVYIVSATISAVTCAAALCILISTRWHGIRFELNAVTTTLVLGGLAGFWITVLVAVLAENINPTSFMIQTDPVTGEKGLPPAYVQVQNASFSLVFFFASAAMLNTSLIWLQVADSARTLSTRAQKNVSAYRNLLLVYYTVFMSAIVGFGVANQRTLAGVVALPAVAFVAVCYALAGYRMWRVAQTLAPSATTPPATGNSAVVVTAAAGIKHKSSKSSLVAEDDNTGASGGTRASAPAPAAPKAAVQGPKDGLRTSLLTIVRTSVALSLNAVCIIIVFVAWALQGGQGAVGPNPSVRVALIPNCLIWLFAAHGNALVVGYAARAASVRILAERKAKKGRSSFASRGQLAVPVGPVGGVA